MDGIRIAALLPHIFRTATVGLQLAPDHPIPLISACLHCIYPCSDWLLRSQFFPLDTKKAGTLVFIGDSDLRWTTLELEMGVGSIEHTAASQCQRGVFNMRSLSCPQSCPQGLAAARPKRHVRAPPRRSIHRSPTPEYRKRPPWAWDSRLRWRGKSEPDPVLRPQLRLRRRWINDCADRSYLVCRKS